MPALTPAQLATWKTDIATNVATVNVGGPQVAINTLDVNNSDHADAIAKWYSLQASPDYFVWRDLPMETVSHLTTLANMTPLEAVPTLDATAISVWQARSLACQGKQFNYQILTQGRDVAPMKRSGYRSALQDCLTNVPAGAGGAAISAGWGAVRDAAKGLANRIEKLLAAGVGTLAAPSDLSYEGGVVYQQLLS